MGNVSHRYAQKFLFIFTGHNLPKHCNIFNDTDRRLSWLSKFGVTSIAKVNIHQ